MTLIIFDIDGTLTDTKRVEDKCFMTAFECTFGLDIRDQDWADLKNVTDWGITEEIIERELSRLPTPEEYQLMISFSPPKKYNIRWQIDGFLPITVPKMLNVLWKRGFLPPMAQKFKASVFPIFLTL